MTTEELKAKRTELEQELVKAQQQIAAMTATAYRIEGAIAILNQMIPPEQDAK